MHCSFRQYRTDPARTDEMMHLVDEGLAERLSEEPGFCEYEVIDCGNGEVFSITLFRDADGAERSNDVAAEFVRDRLAGYDITRTAMLTGEVKVSRARSEVLEAVHA